MSFSSLLKDTFTPYTETIADDGVGGPLPTRTNGTAFKGRLSILGANERLSADKTTVYATHKLYCDASVSLADSGGVTFDGRDFQIRSIEKPSELSSGIGHLEVTLLELD